ncbi:sulfite exporter TauE/SafE family protein [bacterium]|nr:sulfite exporter TauE/SafE family protein [bacterium]
MSFVDLRKAVLSSARGRRRRLTIWAIAVLLTSIAVIVQDRIPGFGILPPWGTSLGVAAVLFTFGVAMVCEMTDSSLGMGYGTTLTPLLLLVGYEPLQIVPCVLLSELLTGLTAAAMHHRDGNVDFISDRTARGTAILLTSLSTIGAVAAVVLALKIPKFWLSAIIGTIILSIGLLIVATYGRRFRYRRSHIVIIGAVAAFNKSLSGGGYGPLVTAGQVVSGLPARHAVAITSLAESFTCLAGLCVYLIATGGKIDWTLAFPLSAGALLSVPIATLTVRAIPEEALRFAVGGFAVILGGLTLAKTFL